MTLESRVNSKSGPGTSVQGNILIQLTIDIVDLSAGDKMSTVLSESTITREIYFIHIKLVAVICPLKQVNPLYRGPLF